MIKINLATRKGPAGSGNDAKGGGKKILGGGFGKVDIRLDNIKELPLRKVVVLGVALFGMDYALTTYQEEQLAQVAALLEKLQQQQSKLEADVAKTKGFEAIKKEIDNDELTMKAKIETIDALIVDRQSSPKMLTSISAIIPADVWLTKFSVENAEVTFEGQATGLAQITDFVKSLNESVYFRDVEPKAGSTKDSVTGVELSTFLLAAKRR